MEENTDEPQPLPTEFLLERGVCCGNMCQNCPYETEDGKRFVWGTVTIKEQQQDS